MQRSIRTAALAALVPLAVGACSSGAGNEADGTTEPTSAPAASQTITMWVDETRFEVFTELVEQYQEEKDVQIELIQKASADIGGEFIQQVPTGEGPDIIVTAHDGLGELVTNGVVQPLELGAKAEEFSDVSIAGFTYDGVVYGLPYAVENIALVRNDALVRETPGTFDELLAQNGTTGATYPILIQQGEQGDPYHLYPLQTSFGAPVFEQNDDGSYTTELGLGGDAGAAYAAYLQRLGAEGVLSSSIDGERAKQAFLDGQSPYIITGPWNATDFVEAGMEISVLPVPSAGGEPALPFVGVQGVYISAKTDNAVVANDFVVNFLGSEDVQLRLAEDGGRAPALIAAADQIDDPIVIAFGEAAGTAPMPSIPQMSSVWQFWGTTEIQIISGQASDPAVAWDGMVANIQAAIDGA